MGKTDAMKMSKEIVLEFQRIPELPGTSPIDLTLASLNFNIKNNEKPTNSWWL